MIKIYQIHGNLRQGVSASSPPAGLRRIVVSRPLEDSILGRPVRPLPGPVESAWFDDLASALAAYGAADVPGLLSAGDGQRFIARENVVIPGETGSSADGSVKLLAFVKRREGFSVEQFQHYWRINHAPLVRKTPLLRRYVQSHPLMEQYAAGEPISDGTAELWWDDMDTYRRSWASPEIQVEQNADAQIFLGAGPCIGIVGEEVIFESD
jgi:uncharacterized protein (TIGR02118 family)